MPPVRPFKMCEVAGAEGKIDGVIVISVPTPEAGAVPLVEERVGVPVE